MADLVYELLSQAVKNTNITINLSAKPRSEKPKTEDAQQANTEANVATTKVRTGSTATTPQESGLVRADLVQLISDLESVSATLKKINRSLVGHEYTEVFFMLQNFDKILTSVKMVVNAV
jgi:hypothetical protein